MPRSSSGSRINLPRSSKSPYCRTCSKHPSYELYGDFFSYPGEPFRFGYVSEVEKSASRDRCPLCLAVVQVLYGPSERRLLASNAEVVAYWPAGKETILKVFLGDEYMGTTRFVQYGDLAWEHYDSGAARATGHANTPQTEFQTLNFSLVRAQLDGCLKEHRECRAFNPIANQRSPARRNSYFIDVHGERLVQDVADGDYFALSYVWGEGLMVKRGQRMFKTTRKSLPMLMKKGGLLKVDLPQAIIDAIEITRRLKGSYLWCDTLCIVQDDPNYRHGQISIMGEIYSGAKVTIASLEGECAADGLLDQNPHSTDARKLPAVRTLDDSFFVPQPPHLADVASKFSYEKRGWTFQERLLSKRCIFFTKDFIYFQCHRVTVTMDACGQPLTISRNEEEINDDVYWDPLRRTRLWADYEWFDCDWMTMTEIYTRRWVSYQEDKLTAYSAISSLLENILHSRMILGMPERCFVDALAWTALAPLERTHLPSWSWCGWGGPVKYPMNISAGKYPSHSKPLAESFALQLPQVGGVPLGNSLVPLNYVDASNKIAGNDAPLHYAEGESIVLYLRAPLIPLTDYRYDHRALYPLGSSRDDDYRKGIMQVHNRAAFLQTDPRDVYILLLSAVLPEMYQRLMRFPKNDEDPKQFIMRSGVIHHALVVRSVGTRTYERVGFVFLRCDSDRLPKVDVRLV